MGKRLKLSTLLKAGFVMPDGTVKTQPGTEQTTTADLSGTNLSYGAAQSVEAAAEITLPDTPIVTITGTTRIQTIAPKEEGTLVRLVFRDLNCIVEDNHFGKGNVKLSKGFYVSVQHGMLCLMYYGGQWIEDHRSNETVFDAWYYTTGGNAGQTITYNTLTNLTFSHVGYFGHMYPPVDILSDDPAPASLNNTTPKTDMALRLIYPGLWIAYGIVTYTNYASAYDPDSWVKAHFMEYYEGGAPDGSTTDPWSAIGDLNQIRVAGVSSNNNEVTMVGCHPVYSDGTNYLKLTTLQHVKDSGGSDLNIVTSGQPYETGVRLIFRGY